MRIATRLGQYLEEFWISLFAWIPTPLGMMLRLVFWRFFFRHCGSVRFGTALTISGMASIALANGCRIGRLSFLTARQGSLVLGEQTSISPCVHLGADNGSIVIGKKVAIGPGTVIRAANHIFVRADVPIMDQGHRQGEIIIEDDVWVGANCVILPDVRIGRGAVIAAGAVVTRSVAPFAIAAGVPARQIGARGK